MVVYIYNLSTGEIDRRSSFWPPYASWNPVFKKKILIWTPTFFFSKWWLVFHQSKSPNLALVQVPGLWGAPVLRQRWQNSQRTSWDLLYLGSAGLVHSSTVRATLWAWGGQLLLSQSTLCVLEMSLHFGPTIRPFPKLFSPMVTYWQIRSLA